MSLLLHPSTVIQLPTALPSGAGSVILHGPSGVGKKAAALELGKVRNCAKPGNCNDNCHSCKEWRVGNFPDLIVVAPEEKASIGIESIRILTQRLSLAPYYESGSRIVIIDSAEALTHAAQNALLKLIEEPPTRTNIILIATNEESLLPTVRSRCRTIFFPILTTSQIQSYLQDNMQLSVTEAKDLAELSGGAVGTALQLNEDSDLLASRSAVQDRIERFLRGSLFDRLILAKELAEKKDNIAVILRLLHQQVVTEIAKNGSNMQSLTSLERLQSQISSNVSPRSAFERFALEIKQ